MEELARILELMKKHPNRFAYWNAEKAKILEKRKPSLSERIVYFQEKEMDYLPEGIFEINEEEIGDWNCLVERRSLLEYNPLQRHPIPYAVIKQGDRYLVGVRYENAGEARLIGKKGFIGGHVSEEDLIPNNLAKTFHNNLYRELKEEVGVLRSQIISKSLFLGIREMEGVGRDHLGLVYLIEVDSSFELIQQEEALGVLWQTLEQMKQERELYESWAGYVLEALIKKEEE